MKLIYVRAARSRGYLTLGFADGEGNKYSYTVSEADYAEIGSPLSGALIESGALEFVRTSDERYRASLRRRQARRFVIWYPAATLTRTDRFAAL